MMETTSFYARRSGLILGFHGTDERTLNDIVLQKCEMKSSNNPWDWIGHGAYFWEHSPSRALEFAEEVSRRSKPIIRKPAVPGAVMELGYCLDLLDYKNLVLLKEIYRGLYANNSVILRRNRPVPGDHSGELLLRYMDCEVIETFHRLQRDLNLPPFDSVKAVFWEGDLLYPNAGFREKNHIQICIRNPDCIKGFFIPKSHRA